MRSAAALISIAGAVAAVPSAQAAVVGSATAIDFSSSPTTISFGGGAASYTFSLVDPALFAYNPDGITTGGTGLVASLGAPFYNPPQPTSYSAGGAIDATTLAQFLSYGSPAVIPYSLSDSFVGLKFDLSDGTHYGYAEVAGPTLLSYAYETTPDLGITTGAAISGAVPEPASWALMVVGFGFMGAAMRRWRTGPHFA